MKSGNRRPDSPCCTVPDILAGFYLIASPMENRGIADGSHARVGFPSAMRSIHGFLGQCFFAALDADVADGAGEAADFGTFGSGALDCVKTRLVTFTTGEAFC